jgi:hypothetical protein
MIDTTEATPTLTRTEHPKLYVLFITDHAYAQLVEAARQALYVRGSSTMLGIGRYLDALFHQLPSTASLTWQDNRPQQLREHDTAMLESGRFPVWFINEGSRIRRNITLLPATIEALTQLARTHGIVNQRRTLSVLNPTSLASTALEAIGQGYLVPSAQPVNQQRSRDPIRDTHGIIRH